MPAAVKLREDYSATELRRLAKRSKHAKQSRRFGARGGELFRIEVAGELKLTRMEYRHLPGGDGAYYSVDGYPLRDGLRAAIGEHG